MNNFSVLESDTGILSPSNDTIVERPRSNHQIVKKIGNYHNLLYRLMLLIGTKRFNFDSYWKYLCSDRRSCPRLTSKLAVAQGGLGTLTELELCSKDQCYQLDQLMISFNKNGNFNIFSVPCIVKSNEVIESNLNDTEVIMTANGKIKDLVVSTIPGHYQIPNSCMETIANVLINLIYDNGQCPHLSRSFGIYCCKDQLKTVMERIPGPTLATVLETLPLEQYDGIITQSLLASFSLYYHGGILHIDAHPKNYLVTPLASSGPGERFYAGQDLYNRRYLEYTNMPREIFGSDRLVIDSNNHLIKLIDYDKVIIDMSQAHHDYLRYPVKFSNLGERLLSGDNLNSLMIKRYQGKTKGVAAADLIGNIANDFFAGESTSGPLLHFLHRMLLVVKASNYPVYRKLRNRLGTVLDELGVDRANLLERSPFSRSGYGKFQDYLRVFINRTATTVKVAGREIKFIGRNFDPQYYSNSLIINWSGIYKGNIFKSLNYLRESLACRSNCEEINLNEKRFNPDFSYTDSLTLAPIETFFNNERYRVYLYRDFPEQYHQLYLYDEKTKSPSELEWPEKLRGTYIRGIYAINAIPGKCRLDIVRNVDLMKAADSTTQNCLVVSGAYFLVKANLENKLGNIQADSKAGDPLGISYFDGVSYVNPFPPAYDNYLLYICIDRAGRHFLFTTAEMLALTDYTWSTFNYQLEDGTVISRPLAVPNLAALAQRYDYRYIYQSGALLYRPGFLFSEQEYQKQFVITEADTDRSELIGKKYFVYSSDESGSQSDSMMFTRTSKSVPSLYAMNVSDVFVNRNVLLYYYDGSYQFLIMAGRGFGAEGIDNAQLARIIYNTPDLSDNLMYACCLDGGFSANLLIKENGDYLYGLEDPERRTVAFTYVFS